MSEVLQIVFMGTPPFAAHILEKLLAYKGCNIKAVYCQPDRPAGRGKKLVSPAVKITALENNIPVYQPLHFKDSSDQEFLASLKPDILVVAAYGLILPQRVLDIAKFAPINVHASLLPLYRGAAPIQRAILDGHKETGVSIMRMEAGLDSGPVYRKDCIDIGEHTSDSLHDVLAELGARSLIHVLDVFLEQGEMHCQVQDHELFTHAPKMRKEDGIIFWQQKASEVHAQIRAVTSWPGAQARIIRPEKENCDIKLAPGRIGSDIENMAEYAGSVEKKPKCGEIWRLDDGTLAVATLDKWYILQNVRPVSKNEMTAEAFGRGYLEKGVGLLAQMQGK